jgi:hypothetical protein
MITPCIGGNKPLVIMFIVMAHCTKLLKYSTITPSGNKRMNTVIGSEGFFASTYLSVDIDEKVLCFLQLY